VAGQGGDQGHETKPGKAYITARSMKIKSLCKEGAKKTVPKRLHGGGGTWGRHRIKKPHHAAQSSGDSKESAACKYNKIEKGFLHHRPEAEGRRPMNGDGSVALRIKGKTFITKGSLGFSTKTWEGPKKRKLGKRGKEHHRGK